MKKKRDILFLCQFFYPEYISSAQLPYDTVLALQDAGFSVGALCGYPREYAEGGKFPTKEDADGIHIHRLKYIQTGRTGFLGRIVNYFSFTFHVLLHLPEIGKYRAVVVYSNPPILPWIASWAKSLFVTKLVFVSYPPGRQRDLQADEPHQQMCVPPGRPGRGAVVGAEELHSPHPERR